MGLNNSPKDLRDLMKVGRRLIVGGLIVNIQDEEKLESLKSIYDSDLVHVGKTPYKVDRIDKIKYNGVHTPEWVMVWKREEDNN